MKRIKIPTDKYNNIVNGFCCELHSLATPQPKGIMEQVQMLHQHKIKQGDNILVTDGNSPDFEVLVSLVAMRKIDNNWHWEYKVEESG